MNLSKLSEPELISIFSTGSAWKIIPSHLSKNSWSLIRITPSIGRGSGGNDNWLKHSFTALTTEEVLALWQLLQAVPSIKLNFSKRGGSLLIQVSKTGTVEPRLPYSPPVPCLISSGIAEYTSIVSKDFYRKRWPGFPKAP